MIPLSQPDIAALEIKSLAKALSLQYLNQDSIISNFETKLAQIFETKYVITVNSRSAAIQIILVALGIQSGDEVITTAFNTVDVTQCILNLGAIPVFCDISPLTFTINPDLIEKQITSSTKSILAVHSFGSLAHIDQICTIAAKYNLPVVEDACQASGSKINGKTVGTYGIAGAISLGFNIPGTGEVIVTNNEALAETAQKMVNQMTTRANPEKVLIKFDLDDRLTIPVVLGLTFLERFDEILNRRATIAGWYHEDLSDEPLLTLPNSTITPDKQISWSAYVIRCCSTLICQIITEHLANQEIQTALNFPATHLRPFLQNRISFKKGDFPETERASSTSIGLPFFTEMTRNQVAEVCTHIKEVLDLYRY